MTSMKMSTGDRFAWDARRAALGRTNTYAIRWSWPNSAAESQSAPIEIRT